jgi:hypothetical protein
MAATMVHGRANGTPCNAARAAASGSGAPPRASFKS